MTELAGKVAAALERSVLPTVIARGAAVRVAAVEDGVVILEVTGSPGAVLPLASRPPAPRRGPVPGVHLRRGRNPRDVERALTAARDRLRLVIE